ncbi:M28 family peptidase [Lacihabitans sp. CCS-44]|uniref:M28 family peptidase n=1 Tax=Lacihabitans sp. CCS-44 TaxID=2487331 RepID=UPI0020CDE64D|nr:M28 family peptidase [Lacihabitans sp. CCS-44]MCP9754827.1 M28 family peptidase [Lacihabitans sp. CCS-44]
MNKISLFFFALFANTTSLAQSPRQTFQETINENDLKKHLTYIASDELGGRDTGSEGQKKAAEYIMNHLKTLGIEPIVKDKNGELGFQQKIELYKNGWKESYVVINDKKKVFFNDYFPVGMINIPVEKEIETVFVGYGIQNEVINDYANKTVKGKAVIFIENDPKNKLGKYISSNTSNSDWIGSTGLKKKQKIATDQAADYIFVISLADSDQFKTLNAERKAILSRFNRLAIEKSKPENPSVSSAIPTFIISKNMASEMLGISQKKLESYIINPESKLKTKKSTIKIKSERGEDTLETANIMGFLEGTDKKDEVIILSAHYDHVGTNEKGQIHNGADDDGSGTCALLELAEAYSKAKATGNGPRRSILFLWVTGEEKGLLGSKYYTDINPIIPLEKTVCDLNIDMIGRVDKKHEPNHNYVYLIGNDKLSSELHAISENANKETINFEIDYEFNDPKDPNRFYYRSDHFNFAKNKIPVIFYFTGVHTDYHKPGDDVEKILFEKYSKIVQLVFATSWELANRKERIIVDSDKP